MYKKNIKLLIFILTLTASSILTAQNIPNSGFEQWNYYRGTTFEIPSGWVTNDVLTSKINPTYKGHSTIKTSEAHSGNYAVKMLVVIDHGDTSNGCIYSTTSIDSVILLYRGKANAGFPFNEHVTDLSGYYKFTAAEGSGDSALFGITLTKWNKQTKKRELLVNTIFLVGQNTAEYKSFFIPFRYRVKKENPDTAFIVIGIQGPNGKPAHPGTTLFIDDISFSGIPSAKNN